MKEKIEEKALIKLKKYNQKQITDLLNILSEEEKEKLYKQVIELDFKKIDKLYSELTKKEKTNSDNIEEIEALDRDKISKDELRKYNDLGKKVIKENGYALVTMSGGQGTRLGYNKPKGEFIVDIYPKPKSLFEIIADKLKATNRRYEVTIPWYIMTSSENHKEINRYFKEHDFFGYPSDYIKFFMQGNLPLITEDKKLILGENKLIREAADGNGGIFNSMYRNNILKDMKNKGVKWK